ncbi:MAG: hypothetical protein NT154_42650, partial [Verrucomicrobia bacterium]|nr:hypothetical protein [Verrucomicrobiota bacterium]
EIGLGDYFLSSVKADIESLKVTGVRKGSTVDSASALAGARPTRAAMGRLWLTFPHRRRRGWR